MMRRSIFLFLVCAVNLETLSQPLFADDVSHERYRALKDSRIALLNREADLLRDIDELKKDIDELRNKLITKLQKLDDSYKTLNNTRFDIMQIQRDML